MHFPAILALLLDVALPEPSPPFKFGLTGRLLALAFLWFLGAIATACFFLFRKTLSAKTRWGTAGICLGLGISGAFIIWNMTQAFDAQAERQFQKEKRIKNEQRSHPEYIPPRNSNPYPPPPEPGSNTNVNQPRNSLNSSK